jgi:hypothetical protein
MKKLNLKKTILEGQSNMKYPRQRYHEAANIYNVTKDFKHNHGCMKDAATALKDLNYTALGTFF